MRQYKPDPIEDEKMSKQVELCRECSEKSGLRMELITNDPECFETLLAKYGKFKGVVNYIAIVGKKNDEMAEENAGYYGERIVLEAQMMRLNICWVGGTYGKGKCK